MTKELLYLTVDDFPQALDVTMENGWVTVWLPTCRVKFRIWKSQ